MQSITSLRQYDGNSYAHSCQPSIGSSSVAYNTATPGLFRCDPVEYGAYQAVNNCMKIQKGEQVVVITDHELSALAETICRQIAMAGAMVDKFVMEEIGSRPEDGIDPQIFPKAIEIAMSNAQASFYMAGEREGEGSSFRRPMVAAIKKHKLRHAHMPGLTREIMSQGMAADYSQIQRLSLAIYNIVFGAKEIRVTSKAGTVAVFNFDKKYPWIVDDGDISDGVIANLPGGEVFTVPVDAKGRVVIDGGLGDHFTAKYGLLTQHPISFELEAGRCVRGSVRCANEALRREFEKYTFETDENSSRVGEFAIGTNIGLTKLIGNLLQDEKFPGVHIALGHPLPWVTGADWDSAVHNDAMIIKATVIVDGRMIMKDGEFVIDY
ncbi:MAG: aminopeptidase [Pseudomonadota bacterium]